MLQPAGILKNTQTGRFHPIVFRPAPMPGGADAESNAMRHKSLGHHTNGLDTIEAANDWIAQQGSMVNAGVVYDWDGVGVPAMVEWFPVSMITGTTAN